MAGGANPAVTQQVVPQMAQKGGGPVMSQGPMVPTGGPQNMVAQPLNSSMANPYTQASMAQQGALATYANPAARAQQMMNPYQQSVVDKTLRDVGNAAQLGLSNLDTRARQASAFGGSRHGIAMAEAAKGYQQQALDAVGALNQQGYNQAMNDAFRAASGLQSAGQQSFGYGQAIQNQQMQQGAMQQQMMQNLINAAKQQYAGYAGQPNQAMNTFMSGISGMPNMGGQTSGYNPGLFNYLQLGASLM